MGEHATGTANFERVLVSSNTAGGDSGGIHLYRISGSVLDSTFENNEADDSGGALGQDAQDGNEKDFLIETSTFTSNVAIAGGAVAFKQDTATITGCTFDAVHKSNCRGASPPLLNHGLHAIGATRLDGVAVWSLAARFSQHDRVLAEK